MSPRVPVRLATAPSVVLLGHVLLLPLLLLLLLLLARHSGAGVQPPNVSLVTMPVGYFGGHHNEDTSFHGNTSCPAAGCRPAQNIAMLSKMRLIMIEKWEGHCYDGCMYNASKGKLCYSSCDVEGDMLKTIASVKTLNPSVLGIMYINTLMAFPFYALSGKFATNDALLLDMYTNKPVELTNDEGMQHVYVYDWGSAKGRQLFLDFIKGLLDSGQADGLFSDKWSYRCSQVNASTWKICNNRCGYVTPAQAAAYNTGAEQVREQISKLLAVNSTRPDTFHGFLYADGLSNTAKCPKAAYEDGFVKVNLVGGWATLRPQLGYVTTPVYGHLSGPEKEKNVHNFIRMVQTYQACGYKYIYIGCGDHSNNAHYVSKAADPFDLATDCSVNHHAMFLLMVEAGVFLGANGWHADYEKPLGAPLGPAVNATDGNGTRLLVRNFASGTNVTWYLDAGYGVIDWQGFPPGHPPPMPTPKPSPAPSPSPPAPTPGPPGPAPPPSSTCTFLNSTDYKAGFFHKDVCSTAEECCGACKGKPSCVVAVFVENSGECFFKKSTKDMVHSPGRISCQPK